MATITEAPGATTVETRLAELRELSESDPQAARDETWSWFKDAGKRFLSDREGVGDELAQLFKAGAPSRGLEGPTEGILVTFTMQSLADRAIGGITGLWMPWAGKRFDSKAAGGDNLLASSARWPSKLFWPFYGMKNIGEQLVAFDFETRIEPGKVDPEIDVLVIDYEPVDSNPALIIKSIRDELVEVVPGAHLGKMLWRHRGGEKFSLMAYFALKSPVG